MIFTDERRVDQGVLAAYAFDLSFGAKENDFEMTLGASEPSLEFGAFVYMEGTEYGGIVDTMSTTTDGESITYTGRTWHGILNSKIIQPDSGANYFTVSGDANEILAMLIDRLGLGDLFTAETTVADISIQNYSFVRYCKAYDGIRAMLEAAGAKLKIEWKDRAVLLRAERITDHTNSPIDGDVATLEVELHANKVNHLICLGRGELAAREVIHLYVDQFGRIGSVQHYTGLAEIVEIYDYNSAESADKLREEGIKKFKELRDNDTAEVSVIDGGDFVYDIGDIVGAIEIRSGLHVASAVTQKIVKIENGAVNIDYKIGSDG